MSNFNFHEPYKEKKESISIVSLLFVLIIIATVAYMSYFIYQNMNKVDALNNDINDINLKLNDKVLLEDAAESRKLKTEIEKASVELLSINEIENVHFSKNAVDTVRLDGIVSSLIEKQYFVSLSVIENQLLIKGKVNDREKIDDLPSFLYNLEKSFANRVPGVNSIKVNVEEDKTKQAKTEEDIYIDFEFFMDFN